MRYIRISLLLLTLNVLSLAGHSGGESNGSKRINALISVPSLVVYVDHGDATVTENPSSEVRAIVKLGAQSIPLLIAHLDDPRPTSAKFKGNSVPVGHVCLDILSNTVVASGILVKDCADCGLGACVNDRYYFRPDAFSRRGGRVKVAQVKANWQRAYQRGRLKFQYPAWWN
jgi:hypothetical protein